MRKWGITYQGWRLTHGKKPKSLWMATKGIGQDLHSFESLEDLRKQIDRKEGNAPRE